MRKKRRILKKDGLGVSTVFLVVALAILPGRIFGQQPVVVSPPAPHTDTLTLGDAIRMGAEGNTGARIARSRATEADAMARQAWSGVLPRVSAVGAYAGWTLNTASFGLDFPSVAGQPSFFDPDGEVVGPIRNVDLRGRIEVPLVDLAAIDRLRSGRSMAGAAHVSARAAADVAGLRAGLRYLDVLRAREELAARREDLALAEDLLGMARAQLEAGVGIGLDVTRAEAQVATVRAQIVDAEADLDRAGLALRRALGISLDAPLHLADSLPGLSTALPTPVAAPNEGVVGRALSNRSEIRAAEMSLEATERALDAARARRLPSLSVVADDGFYGSGFGNLLNTYTWRVQLSMPVFAGLEIRSRIDQRRAQALTGAYELEDLKEEIAFEARTAVLATDAARRRTDAARQRLELARQEVEEAEERVLAGVSGNGDLVRAALRLSEARIAHVRALVSVQEARLQLAWAEGEVMEINIR